ncbi:hypothetical protein HDU81_005144 [Chytriomyces hyalinus]|nr:hypothetical protein HDU81_005144 [Chytriomyces hyalinus]
MPSLVAVPVPADSAALSSAAAAAAAAAPVKPSMILSLPNNYRERTMSLYQAHRANFQKNTHDL